MMTLGKLLAATFALAGLYQVAAVWLGWWPPITELVRSYRGSAAVWVVVFIGIYGLAWWATVHLLHDWWQ